MHMRAAETDFLHRLDEIDAVIVVFLDARGDREHIGIENDVFGRKADADKQLVGPLADLDLALPGIGLTLLVEGHDHHRRAVIHAFSGV